MGLLIKKKKQYGIVDKKKKQYGTQSFKSLALDGVMII